MKTPGIYYGVLAAFFIVTLIIGHASASDLHRGCVMNRTGVEVSMHNPFVSPDVIITRPEQQGVNVSEVRTALKKGDNSTVQSWLEQYRATYRPEWNTTITKKQKDLTNTTSRQQGITGFKKQGNNITGCKAGFRNSNMTVVKAGLVNNPPAHPLRELHNITRFNPDAMITRLEENGVDVSSIKTSIRNGDTSAVGAWLKSYFKANKGFMNQTHAFRHRGTVNATTIPVVTP